MKTSRHGISIGMERTANDLFLTIKAIGKLTHADYQTITPMLDAALGEMKKPKIKALVD